jgi:hypothetical protein
MYQHMHDQHIKDRPRQSLTLERSGSAQSVWDLLKIKDATANSIDSPDPTYDLL